MKCRRCQHFNDPGAKFCAECASPLTSTCAHCDHELQATAKFCSECGRPTNLRIGSTVDGPGPQSGYGSPGSYTPTYLAKRILESRSAIEGERKQVTVLFADLKGSMELLAERDPEEARKLLDPVVNHMTEAVHHYEGTVNQVAGDGIMALFGAPVTHEDHAVRACYAALRMQERVKRYAADVFHADGVNIQIRVGLNSGEVVVGTIGSDLRMDYTAVGRTSHLAARMEQLAIPGSILLAPSTLKLAESFVTAKPLGPVPVKGLAEPLEVYELTGVGSVNTRFQSVAQRGLVCLVGRDVELARLERGLERASAGKDCVIGVVAEAGIGKSRLCFEFAERCRARAVPVLAARAVAHSRATPYLPVINAVKVYCGIALDDTSELARAKVNQRLNRIDFGFEGAVPLLFDFLGIAEPGSERPLLDPDTRRERLNSMFHPLIRAAALHRPGSGPGVMLLEDLHWADPGSESILEVFIDALQDTKTLLIVNHRPGYTAPWMKRDHYEQILLAPLPPPDADALAARLLGDDDSIASLLPLIADRATGNPLFIEELVRKFEESGYLFGQRGAYRLVQSPDMRLIPETVQAIIGARIDSRPEAEKAALQAAAVIGREFALSVLARILGVSELELSAMLWRLVGAGLIVETDGGPGLFGFAHPMMQEVAYGSMLSERRRNLHVAVATELEKTWPDPDGAQASLIAHHWEEGGNPRQAIDSNMKAAVWYGTGDVARTVFTSEWDRVRDPGRALETWKRIHRLAAGLSLEGAARQQLLAACGQILNFGWREGLTAADLKPYYLEALEIARSLGRMRLIVLLNAAYGRALAGSGPANDYLTLANETLGMFSSPEHASLAVQLTAVRCHAHMLVGNLHAALADNDYVLANLHQIEEKDTQTLTLAYSPPVWAKYMRGRIFALMGRYDEAQSILDELIAGDDATVSEGHRLRAHLAMTSIAFGLGNQTLAKAHASAARRLAHSNRTPFFRGVSRICTGLELSLRGDNKKAMAMFGDALRNMRNPGLEGEAAIRCHLAHAQLRAGSFDASRATAKEAANLAQHHGNKIWLAYAEWLIEGPDSPTFKRLIRETGAEHFMRLRHPRHDRLN
jgi:class 3 adenylate cyclase/tetratricopeptide (TPR) repeat protein